jgi:hypothetical protein
MRKNKEHLKQQITIQKYFKEKQPRFITFSEVQLIRKLHEINPEEWTKDRLSDSFPVLPHTVQKILSSKWVPESVNRIMQYNNVAVENWKKFKTGKLVVDPIFNKHLMKFRDRKIILTDAELLAKQFVPPEIKFKKPKCQLFSSIIKTCSNESLLPQENDPNQTLAISEHSDQAQDSFSTNIESNSSLAIIKNSEKFTSGKEWNSALISQENSEEHDLLSKKKKSNSNKPLTFNKFVEKKLEDICKESPEEGIVLLDVYRKQVEAALSDNAMINAEETAVSKDIQKPDKNDCVTFKNENNMLDISKQNTLDTYVKVWNKKIDTELEYTKSINITKQLYKKGKTYRINDCYYDDDGEFLYRVPGIQN